MQILRLWRAAGRPVFAVPLFLSVALGVSAVAIGVRLLLPPSVTLLLAAVGVPRLFPHASLRRWFRSGFSRANCYAET